MKADESEARLTLWFRGILFAAFGTIIASFIQSNNQYNQLKLQSNLQLETIEELQYDLEQANNRLAKTRFVQNELDCMARNIYFEAQSESYDGKLAVATVTRNRVRSGLYPNTICGVVYQDSQFSWTNDNKRVNNTRAFAEAKKVAEEVVLKGKRSTQIDSKVMFYHADYANPYWANSKEFVTQIGTHIFYR